MKIDPKHAEEVRAMVLELAKEGKSVKEIVQEMNRAGYKTASGLEFNEQRVFAILYYAKSRRRQNVREILAPAVARRRAQRTAYFRKPSGPGLHIDILRDPRLTDSQNDRHAQGLLLPQRRIACRGGVSHERG